MWELIRIEASPCSIYSLIRSNSSSLAITSRPAVGSSRIRSFALCDIATSTLSFAFIPVENSFIFLSIGILKCLHFFRKSFWSNAEYILVRIGRISFTVRYPLKPESDRTTPISSLSFAERLLISFPNTSIFPPSVLIRPRIALNVVLFPAPFWPINPVTQPLCTSREHFKSNCS